MSEKIVSKLRFNDYEVDKMVFIRNHEFDDSKDEDIALKFSFSSEVLLSSEKEKGIIILTCKLFEEDFSENNLPFYLELTMRGYYDCEEVEEFEDFELNAMAILLPYLRSTITSFTAQAGIAPVIIPPINVFNVFKNREETKQE